MNIADIQSSVTLFLETGQFEADAAKAGESAGATVGASMSGKIKASLGGMALAGVGLEIGKQIVGGLESAFSKIANVIPSMLQSGQAFGLNVEDITKKTGASAETASRFVATLTYLGQSTEGLGQMLKTLSVQVVSNEAQFKKLGIATRDGNGNLLDSITILNNLRSYLSTAGDGATKLALATHLLGKSAGNLIEYLDLTDAQAKALNDTFDALGVTMSEKAVADIEGATRESSLLGIAWQGVSNVITTELAPTIRQVLGAAFQFIVEHGAEVRQTIVDITNAALGLISGLLGIEGVTPFQTQLDALGGSASNVTLGFDAWAQQMGYTVPKIAATTAASKGAGSAIAAQTKEIDKQVASLNALEKQQGRTYTAGLDALNAQLDAQGKLFDAQDQTIARAKTDEQLQRSLRDASEALTKAQLDASESVSKANADQSLSPTAKAQAAIDAATSVRNAEESLAQARQAIADEARTRSEQDRKGQIADVKAYLADIDKLVQDADNRKANLATLGGMEKGLKAAGPAAPGSDAAIQLQGVLAGEQRIRQAMANTTKIDALTAKKDQLSQEAAAQSSADSASVTANKTKLAQLKAEYDKYRADQKKTTAAHVKTLLEIINGPDGNGGLGGAFSAAFGKGQAAADALKKAFDSVAGSVGTVVDLMGQVTGTIAGLDKNELGLGLIALGVATGNLPAALAGIAMESANVLNAKPTTDPYGNAGPGKGSRVPPGGVGGGSSGGGTFIPGKATGGIIPPLTWAMTGERGPEPVYGGTTGVTVLPNSALGGQPAIIRLEIGGRPLLDYVDQNLAYRRLRRT